MGRWYQVFDDERINAVTRSAARRHVLGAALLVAATLAATVGVLGGHVSSQPVIVLLAGLWGWAGGALFKSWRHLRSQVWCVKISDREVVGYDYRRHRIRIDWIDARRIDIERRGLGVTSTRDIVLEVPSRFPEYAALCNALLHQAEFYQVPVFVDGKELAAVTASDVFPFLDEFDNSE